MKLFGFPENPYAKKGRFKNFRRNKFSLTAMWQKMNSNTRSIIGLPPCWKKEHESIMRRDVTPTTQPRIVSHAFTVPVGALLTDCDQRRVIITSEAQKIGLSLTNVLFLIQVFDEILTTNMIFSTEPILTNVVSLFVYDEIFVLETYGATSCSFILIEGISFGYQYSESEDADDKLHRAFCVIFEKTLKRLKSKGVNLPSIDI